MTRKQYMTIPKMVTNTSASAKSSPRLTKINQRDVAWFSLFVLVGVLAILYPLFVLVCLAAAATLGLCWLAVVQVRRAGLEFWQVPLLIAVTGYLLLNYGFENLSLHIGGFPIIISYGLMFASLALAVSGRRHLLARALKEPAMLCVLALLGLTALHLVVDIPSYGLWAVRDSSMCLDGIFMLLGMLWAMKTNSTFFLTKWLMVVFVLNAIYGFTLPWGEKIWSWSPQSGVFLSVPLLGNFNGTGDLLLSGALFCICVGGYVIARPRWLMLFLAMAQLLGVAISQVRRMYVAALIVLVILVLLGEAKKFAKLFVLLPAAVIVILLATTFGGLEISGRVGTVNLEFFREHIRSLSDAEGTPGSSVQSRFSMADEAFQHFLAHPVVGEGFGQPLLTEMDANNSEGNNAVTRMPHNSSLSYLARLGGIGFAVWIAFHFCLIKRFIYGLRQRGSCDDKRLSALVLWFFLFYVLFMIGSLVEAAFEFPSGAIPFYFFMGFALGLIRWQLSDKNNSKLRLADFAHSVEKA
jgi:hypothetical protein